MYLFKNYGWLFLMIFSCQGILQAEDNQDCVKPTQYIMQFLAKSGTVWRGNKEWLKDLKKGASIKTDCLYIRNTETGNSKEYTGFFDIADAPKDYNNAEDHNNIFVSVYFNIIQENDDSLIIKSSIKDTRMVIDLQKIEILKSDIKENNGKNDNSIIVKSLIVEKQEKDNCSECHRRITANFDDATNKFRITTISSCTTKMPLDLFKKEIEKNRNGFK